MDQQRVSEIINALMTLDARYRLVILPLHCLEEGQTPSSTADVAERIGVPEARIAELAREAFVLLGEFFIDKQVLREFREYPGAVAELGKRLAKLREEGRRRLIHDVFENE